MICSDQVGVLAVAPLDGVAAHLHDGLLEVLDLPLGQRGVGEEVGEHVVGLLEVGRLAADVEVDLAGGAAALVLVAPGQGLVDRLEELVGGERLGQVAVGADPDARGAVVGVVQRGDHDDRDQVRLAVPLELVADGEPVEVGEHQVEQDQVGRVLADGVGDLGARVELDRLEVAGLDQAGQDVVGVALVVDDQHGARHGQGLGEMRRRSRLDRDRSRPFGSIALSRAGARLARRWTGRGRAPLRDGPRGTAQ